MDQHALLMHTLIRQAQVDSPERARRREHLLWLERDAREAHRRPRERVRRVGNGLITLHRTVSQLSPRARRSAVAGSVRPARDGVPPPRPARGSR
jgi:hypothetical protein